jgi:hypothetical protein
MSLEIKRINRYRQEQLSFQYRHVYYRVKLAFLMLNNGQLTCLNNGLGTALRA